MFCIAALFTFFSHFVVVFRSQKEEQLRRAKAEAVAGTVRMLAHDVRKPFSTLRAGMTMISNATIDDKTRVTARVANELERNLKNVNRMILDVMDFGSNRPMNTETANLSSLVNDCYQDLQMDCEARGILLERQITEDILGTFDVLKVKRALSNILQNAIEATPKGLRITVKLEEIAAGKVISVCNEGSYIEKEGLSKVFDEFYTKHKPYGSGLGLTIAKEFIEAQGGKLYCESDIAKGTTFYIVMPYPEK
jgi:signal transduction histidine kinase